MALLRAPPYCRCPRLWAPPGAGEQRAFIFSEPRRKNACGRAGDAGAARRRRRDGARPHSTAPVRGGACAGPARMVRCRGVACIRAPCALARARPPPPRSGARALLSHAVRVGIHARRLHVPASVHAACVFVRSLLLSRVPWAPETRELCARVCACTLYHAHAHLHTHAHVYTRKHVRTHAQACRGVCALPCDLADAPVSLRMYT